MIDIEMEKEKNINFCHDQYTKRQKLLQDELTGVLIFAVMHLKPNILALENKNAF